MITLEGNEANVDEIKFLQKIIEELLEATNGYWRQRSRSNWLLHGDHNTAYFYHHANHRCWWNHISKITTVNREVATHQQTLPV